MRPPAHLSRYAAFTVIVAPFLFAVPGAAIAQAPATQCTSMADRATGLRLVRLPRSLSNLSLSIVGNTLVPADISLLEGPCADDVQAIRMSQMAFSEGAVFNGRADGTMVHAPDAKGLTNFPGPPLLIGPPLIDQARLITAANIDGTRIDSDRRALDVGVWQAGDSYLAAAFIRQGSGASVPVELVRSKHPIQGLTFFPSPDANAGRLALLVHTGHGNVLVSFNWDHAVLTRRLRSGE